MDLEPLNTSLMTGRVAIAAVALSHTLFATFIVGTTLLAAITATLAYRIPSAWYGRLAHMMAFALVLSTATISFLGVSLVFALNIFWPKFWHHLFSIMFWPFLLEAGFFFGEAVSVYAWYYLWTWSKQSSSKRRWHLSFIWLGAASALIAMVMIDITASFMLTPASLTPWWSRVFNPSFIVLDVHRWFGNLVWAGFALAALCGIGWLRTRQAEEQAYFRKAATYCFAFGFGALLIMPLSGFEYLLTLRYTHPQVFHTLMLGERSPLFDLVALLYGGLVTVGVFYIYRTVRESDFSSSFLRAFFLPALLVLAGATVVAGMPYHLQHIPFMHYLTDAAINPLGKMQPNKYVALVTLVIFGLASFLFLLLSRGSVLARDPALHRDRLSPTLLLALATLSILIYVAMGWTRETARAANGYLIYEQMKLVDEAPTYGGIENAAR